MARLRELRVAALPVGAERGAGLALPRRLPGLRRTPGGRLTADVFRRLALVAGCSGWATAVALVWVHVGWAAGLAAAVLGPAGAFALSLERGEEMEPGPPAEEPAGLSHREIARRARAARGSDDDE